MACAPGSTKGCVSAGEKGVCAEDGSTYVPVACPEELPFCNQGECVLCLDASVCPAPKSPCLQAACIAGKCGVKPYPQGYTPEEQTAGDCRRVECDGKGDTVLVPDSTDPPKSDLSCVGYVCEEGKATPFNKPAGASCGEGCYCNGKGNVGKCIPGTSTCNEGVQEYCDDGWVVKTVCKEEQPACSEGSCRGVTQVVAGGDHACAVLTNQRVHCWGRNHVGQLGLGTNHPTQAQFGAVEGLAGVESLAAGDHHTCAIIKGGKVFCWGDNEFGQVGAGAGSLGYYTSPTEVKGLSDVIQISLGRGFSCALNATGKVSCWGRNHPNLITTGWNQPNVFSPKLIPLEPASQITTGNAHACILAKTGNVVCWGSCEFWQKGGAPSAPCGESWDAPAVTAGLLPGVTQVQAGGDHTCALSPGGVQCWGRNDKGQLGIKKSSNQEPPTLTEFPKPSKAGMLALGTDYTCLVADGSVSCVGWNMIGQLGRNYLPTPGVHPEFEVLPGAVQAQDGMPLSGVVQISARTDFSLVLRTDGNLLGWGNGQHGNIFGGSSSPDPSPYYLAAYIPFVN
jgi:alpha-tubulin suppressor-like RCC1 family protein